MNALGSWVGGAVPTGAVATFGTPPAYQPFLTSSLTLTEVQAAAGGYDITGAPGAVLTLSLGTPIVLAGNVGSLTFDVPVTFSAATAVGISVGTGSYLTMNGAISGASAGLTLSGRIFLNGTANTYSGDTTLGTANVTVASLGNAGSASGLGESGTIHVAPVANSAAILNYAGAGETSNKAFDLSGTTATPYFMIDTTGATGGLVLTGNISSSSTGTIAKTVALRGDTAGNVVSGVISDNSGAGSGATVSLDKAGSGTWSLTGSNTYSGATAVFDGTLLLDFSGAGAPATNIVSASSALVMNGGTLAVQGASGAANSQAFASTSVALGASTISVLTNGASGVTANLGAVTHTIGATVNFATQAGGTLATTTADTVSTSGYILGGWATVGGTDWATVFGGDIVGYSSAAFGGTYVNDTWSIGNNTTVTTNSTTASNAKTNSLRFDGNASSTVTLVGIDIVTSGGVLVTSDVVGKTQTVTGGTLRSGSGELDAIVNDTTGKLVIASTLDSSSGYLVKSGLGTLDLTGTNTSYAQNVYMNAGTLQIGNASALGSSSQTLYMNGGTLSSDGTTARTINDKLDFVGTGSTTANNVDENTITLGDAVNNGVLTFANSVQVDTYLTLDVASDVVFSGNFGAAGNNGVYSFTKTGAGTLTLNSASNFFLGPLTVAQGALVVNGTMQNHPAVLINGTGASFKYTNATTTLASGVSFGGSGGSFLYDSPVAFTGGAVVAGNHALLGGTGTLAAIGIVAGGTLAPGDGGVGTLTTTTQTWGGGGTYAWEIGDAAGAHGTGWDLVAGTTLTLAATAGTPFTISLTGLSLQNFNPAQSYTWDIGDFTSVAGFNPADFALTESGFGSPTGTFSVAQVGNNIDLVYTAAVPEPSVLALLAVGASAVVGWRRRVFRTA